MHSGAPQKLKTVRLIKSLDELQQLNSAAAKSQYFEGKHLPLFKSAVIKNYKLLEEFPGKNAATEIPAHVIKLMGIPTDEKGFVGAYE